MAAFLGALGGGLISGIGSLFSANKQAEAAQAALGEQKREADAALGFQKQVYSDQQANAAPWLRAGTQGINDLSSLLDPKNPNGLLTQWSGNFQAPTADQARQTPGYQFAQQEGQNAVQRSAAAKGDLLTGGTLKDLTNYSQGLADTNYQQTYNNALTQYQLGYNQFQQGQSNTFNRLAALSGIGQTATGQLNQASQSAANNVANIDLSTGAQQAQSLNNIGAAQASGYAGVANAGNSTLNNLSQYSLIQQLLGGGGGGGSVPYGNLDVFGSNPMLSYPETPQN